MHTLILFLSSIFFISEGFANAGDFIFDPSSSQNYRAQNYLEERVIDGTSPILGYELVSDIKKSNLHPEEIYNKIIEANPNFFNTVSVSSLSYFETMMPGLKNYCAHDLVFTEERSMWHAAPGNHGAAIPQEILAPLSEDYLKNLSINQNLSPLETLLSAGKIAKEFKAQRFNCKPVKKLEALEEKLKKICLGLGFCLKAEKINHIISSAEAAYPRVQFAINGFTRYVFDNLLKTDELPFKLKTVYNLEQEWLKEHQNKEKQIRLFDFIIEGATHEGIHVKDTMLILAYSMRNMPSIDVEYMADPHKALLLESYFWKFSELREILSSDTYFKDVFPKKVFKRNPGFYHYLTASLLGCEARLSGLSHTSAVLMGIFSKVGYKTDKLVKAIDKEVYKKIKNPLKKLNYVTKIMKTQGYWPGVAAGKAAAAFGSKSCKAYMNILKKDFRKEKKELRKNSTSRKEFKALKKELKNEYKKKIRSLLDDLEEEEG